jgi:hypothetical protein
MDKASLKKVLLDAVEARADDIIAAGDWIWRNPEAGFKEFKTAEYTAGIFRGLALDVEENIGLTGVQAKISGREERPNIAVIGELDALLIPEHPESDPDTGAVHSCGHNGQMANMIGVAMALVDSGVMEHLDGSVTCMAVPRRSPSRSSGGGSCSARGSCSSWAANRSSSNTGTSMTLISRWQTIWRQTLNGRSRSGEERGRSREAWGSWAR